MTGLLVSAAVAALLLAAPSGNHHLDVIDQARAALVARGDILHMRITTHFDPNGSGVHCSRSGCGTTTEQWSVTGPPRWRTLDPDFRIAKGPGGSAMSLVENSYAAGVLTTYDHHRRAVKVTSGYSTPGVEHPPSVVEQLGPDPIAELRSLLDRHVLRDTGLTTAAGKPVRRLIGSITRPIGRGRTGVTRIEYDVDPQTFRPIAAAFEFPLRQLLHQKLPHNPIDRLHFDVFEHLPPTIHNLALLTIRPPAGTPTTKTTR